MLTDLGSKTGYRTLTSLKMSSNLLIHHKAVSIPSDQGRNTAEVGFEPPSSRSGVQSSTTEPLPHHPVNRGREFDPGLIQSFG